MSGVIIEMQRNQSLPNLLGGLVEAFNTFVREIQSVVSNIGYNGERLRIPVGNDHMYIITPVGDEYDVEVRDLAAGNVLVDTYHYTPVRRQTQHGQGHDMALEIVELITTGQGTITR